MITQEQAKQLYELHETIKYITEAMNRLEHEYVQIPPATMLIEHMELVNSLGAIVINGKSERKEFPVPKYILMEVLKQSLVFYEGLLNNLVNQIEKPVNCA